MTPHTGQLMLARSKGRNLGMFDIDVARRANITECTD